MENDGFLVEIKSQSQEQDIEDYWQSQSEDREHAGLWIGLNDLILEGIYNFLQHLHAVDNIHSCLKGTFMWDKSLELVNYTNWGPDEPNNADSGEDCVEIGFGIDGIFSQRLWNDAPCNSNNSYALCEPLPRVDCTNNTDTLIYIIGILFGVIVLLLLSAGVIFFIRRRKENLDVKEGDNVDTYDTYYDKNSSVRVNPNSPETYDTYSYYK